MRLAGRDAAIVADEPGTTRDAIEVTLDLDGAKVRLIDTAGLRDNAGPGRGARHCAERRRWPAMPI